MNIVVLDGHTLNPGDLDWGPLHDLGACTVHERTDPDELLDRAGDAAALLINKIALTADTIRQLPALRYIGVTATGYNVVDTRAATEHDIVVTNVPTYGTRSVAQMVIAHLLNLAHRVALHSDAVKSEGAWCDAADFCFWRTPQVELAGLTLGIVGYGRIGQATADLARAFGLRILASTEFPETASENTTFVDLDTLFQESDVVSLHCPLTPETEHLVSAERLAQMKPSAWLINTSRGPLVDEAALAAALNEGRLAGAGLDVLSVEPPAPDNPLLGARNCFITPHIAWATKSSRQRLLDIVIANLKAFQEGSPVNVVN